MTTTASIALALLVVLAVLGVQEYGFTYRRAPHLGMYAPRPFDLRSRSKARRRYIETRSREKPSRLTLPMWGFVVVEVVLVAANRLVWALVLVGAAMMLSALATLRNRRE